MRRRTGMILWVLPLSLLLGCGGSAKEGSSSASSMAAQTYATANGDFGWEEGTDAAAYDSAADMETADMGTVETGTAGGSGSQEVSDAAARDAANRKLIKTVSLDLQTKEFDTLKQNLEKEIEHNGGYVESSDYYVPQGENQYRYYNLTVRIPEENLDAFVETAGSLGTLTDKSENVEDVTLNYVDMTAYKESLQLEYERVTEILEEATKLDQILALESKLSELRYEINSYESQLRTYDNLISYSTVHIYISEVEVVKDITPTVGSRISNGFRESLQKVKNFFVDLFVWVVSHVPELVVLAVCVGIIVVLVKKIGKRAARRRKENLQTRAEKARCASVNRQTTAEEQQCVAENLQTTAEEQQCAAENLQAAAKETQSVGEETGKKKIEK